MILRLFAFPAFFPPFFRQLESLWLGIHSLEHRYREIHQVFGISLTKTAVVSAIISVFANTMREVSKFFWQTPVVEKPFQTRREVPPRSSVQTYRKIHWQERFGCEIDRQPQHCCGTIPCLNNGAGSRFIKSSLYVWRRKFWCGLSRPISQIQESIDPKMLIEGALNSCGRILPEEIALLVFGLHQNEHRRSVAVPTYAKSLVFALPSVLNGRRKGLQNIKGHFRRIATWAINNQNSHRFPLVFGSIEGFRLQIKPMVARFPCFVGNMAQ